MSLGAVTPALPVAAADATVQLLARLAVVRALARRERVPGSVAALWGGRRGAVPASPKRPLS